MAGKDKDEKQNTGNWKKARKRIKRTNQKWKTNDKPIKGEKRKKEKCLPHSK